MRSWAMSQGTSNQCLVNVQQRINGLLKGWVYVFHTVITAQSHWSLMKIYSLINEEIVLDHITLSSKSMHAGCFTVTIYCSKWMWKLTTGPVFMVNLFVKSFSSLSTTQSSLQCMCHPPIHTHTHTLIQALIMWHQEQPGVQCLAQGHTVFYIMEFCGREE